MNKLLKILNIFLYIFISQAQFSIADDHIDQSIKVLHIKKNKDGMEVLLLQKMKSPISIDIYLKSSAIDKNKLHLVPNADETDNPFFSAQLIDIDHDGFWDVEETGICGNKVCDKTIFRFNPHKQKFFKFFSGAYSQILVFNNYLIESGSSGCCGFEYHAYKIISFNKPITKEPDYIINVKASANLDNENSNSCSFTNSVGDIIPPPDKSWMHFCEVYGNKYNLITK
jgi:hypothetical protein